MMLVLYADSVALGELLIIVQIKYHFYISGVIISRPLNLGWVLKAVTGQISGLEFINSGAHKNDPNANTARRC